MKKKKPYINRYILTKYSVQPLTPRNKYKSALKLLTPKTVSLLPSDELTNPIFYSWSNRAALYAHLNSMGWHWQKEGRVGYWSDSGYWTAQIPF